MGNLPSQVTSDFYGLLDADDFDGAAALVAGAVESADPELIFLSSSFGRAGESVEEFDLRSLSETRRSAQLGYAPAIFRLGCYLLFGDFVGRDPELAHAHFEIAAKSGFPPAMYEYGLSILSRDGGGREGAGGESARDEGMRWIRRAAELGYSTAADFLSEDAEE